MTEDHRDHICYNLDLPYPPADGAGSQGGFAAAGGLQRRRLRAFRRHPVFLCFCPNAEALPGAL